MNSVSQLKWLHTFCLLKRDTSICLFDFWSAWSWKNAWNARVIFYLNYFAVIFQNYLLDKSDFPMRLLLVFCPGLCKFFWIPTVHIWYVHCTTYMYIYVTYVVFFYWIWSVYSVNQSEYANEILELSAFPEEKNNYAKCFLVFWPLVTCAASYIDLDVSLFSFFVFLVFFVLSSLAWLSEDCMYHIHIISLV